MEEAENPVATGRKRAELAVNGIAKRISYYLFLEKAPDWFIERHHLRELVNQALKEDEALCELVHKFKKTRISKEKEKE